jgi:sporulation protein YlmC with PRC-barrel domain
MKTFTIYGAALAILGLAAAPLFAQTQTQTTSSSTTGYVEASKIIGTKVKSAQGQEVGVVKDVVLDQNNGCMAYTVLSTGGTVSRSAGGGKLVAVPWTVYSSRQPGEFVVQVDQQRIYNAPAFEYSRINEYSTSGYLNNVAQYYGVSAGVGVGGGYSSTNATGATSTTGVSSQTNAQTNAYASPSANASVGAGVSPSPSASAAATASAAVGQSPQPSASASAAMSPPREKSPTTSERGKAHSSASPSSRHHRTEEGAQGRTEESAGETGEETTKKSRHSRSEESATESSPSNEKSSRRHETEGAEATPPSSDRE